jgi:hypothetical protein
MSARFFIMTEAGPEPRGDVVYHELPLNHPSRVFYRTLVVLIGVVMLVFGGVSLSGSSPVLGLGTNVGLGIVALIVGVVAIAAALFGRANEHLAHLGVSGLLALLGLWMLAFLRTGANLGASMSTCLTTLVLSLFFLLAGTYTKLGTAEEALAKERERHGNRRPEDVRAEALTAVEEPAISDQTGLAAT